MKHRTNTRIDKSGQLPLRKALRDAAGLAAGTEAEIEAVDRVIVIRRSGATGGEPSIARLRALIADGLASGEARQATDELLSELRARAIDPDG